jgi:primase-polymerase (primpol)-like protein
MRTVTITISDKFGNVTNDTQKHTYQLDLQTEGFDSLEKAVINLKNQMLPDLQKQLLEEEQEEFIKKKPESLRCNGTAPITIKTLNGSFTFKNQRFLEDNCDQTSHTYLGLTKQFEDGYFRSGLKEFSA